MLGIFGPQGDRRGRGGSPEVKRGSIDLSLICFPIAIFRHCVLSQRGGPPPGGLMGLRVQPPNSPVPTNGIDIQSLKSFKLIRIREKSSKHSKKQLRFLVQTREKLTSVFKFG